MGGGRVKRINHRMYDNFIILGPSFLLRRWCPPQSNDCATISARQLRRNDRHSQQFCEISNRQESDHIEHNNRSANSKRTNHGAVWILDNGINSGKT